MKKVIIVLLLLIPLIVLFTITASGKIISAEVSIAIENFELWHMGEPVTEATINLGEYRRKKLKYQLIPRYFPGVAMVSGFRWYSDDESVATVDEDGIVTFKDCGFAKITAQSLDTSSVKASCSFFVEDDAIHTISLCAYDSGAEVNTIALSVYEERVYRTDVTPYSALVGDLAYESSDITVFTVSSTGIITAKGQGTGTLSIRATDKNGDKKVKTIPVSVSGTALIKQRWVYVYGEEVDLTPYLTAGAYRVGGNAVSLAGLKYGESRDYEITNGSRTETVTVTRLEYAKQIGVLGLELMKENAWKEGVYLAVDRRVTLTPIDLSTYGALSGVSVQSDHPDVLRVEGGALRGVSVGKATLRFEKADYQSFSLEVTVATPISYFALNFDADNDVIGVGSDRVYGMRSTYDGVIVEGIRVTPEQIYPATGGINLFTYSVAEDYASVDKSGLVTFREEAAGRPVTVTVKSAFSTNGITRSYTFRHLVKGINVGFGYGANPCDPDKGILPSFAPYYDALNTMYEERDQALVYQTNVYVPNHKELDALPGKYHKLTFIRDMYGNGYKIDGQFFQYNYESRMFDEGKDDQIVDHPEQKGITISDLFVNSYAPMGSDSKKTFEALMEKGGVPIRTYYIERPDFEIRFRYCVFQYAYTHAITIGGTVVFDGCVFRNSAGVAFLVESIHRQETYLTVNNCVFSNSISMTGLVTNGTFPKPAKEQTEYNAIRWTGKNYIYNWKKVDDIRLDIIPQNVMKDEAIDAVLAKVNDKLSECIRLSMKYGNRHLVVKKEEESYVNMGVMFVNFWNDPKMVVNEPRASITDGMLVEYDPTLSTFTEIDLDTTALGTIEMLAREFLEFDNPSYMITNRNGEGEYSTAPGETYKLDEKTFARLRGEGE